MNLMSRKKKIVKNKVQSKWNKRYKITTNNINNQKGAVKYRRLNLKKMMRTLSGWSHMQANLIKTVTLWWRLEVW